MPGPRKGRNDIASEIRGAFKRGCIIIENKSGKGLSELIAEAIESDGILRVLDTMAKYCPKDLNVTSTEMTPEAWLEYMAEADASLTESTDTETPVSGPVH